MTAPAIHPALYPHTEPIPIKATPTVAIVVQELPHSTDITAQTPQTETKKNLASRYSTPNVISVGTMPDSIHVADTQAININIGIVGNTCDALLIRPLVRLRIG
jgi:hypothetical protein